MNPGPPLSYESLKTVLQYMDPNLRIRLAINCPSIRSVEKVVPLKIKNLELESRWIAIDDTRYTVGIYKKYPEGMCPPLAEKENGYGGLDTDLDQHGYEDRQTSDELRPGDVDLRRQHNRQRVYHEINEVEIKGKEKELSELQKRLDHVESFGPIITSEADDSCSKHSIERITSYFVVKHEISEEFSALYSRQPEFEPGRAKAYKELKNQVLELKATLQQWYARRDGLPVPFESYIVVTISNDETKEKKNVEFVKYEKSMFEAFRYLMQRIFENRRYPVAVRVLIPFSGIIRLTPGLRMRIEEMHFDKEVHRAIAELTPYIEESSYPLKCLKVYVFDSFEQSPEIFQETKLRSAEHLVLVGLGPIEWLPIYLNLDNHKVHTMVVDYYTGSMSVDDFMTIIRHWTSTGKEVGSSFSFGLQADEDELEMEVFHISVFKRIKTQFKESVSGHRYVKIPTVNETTLKVSVEESGDEDFQWNLVLLILPLKQ